MNKQIEMILKEGQSIDDGSPLKKIYIHSLIEFRKIERILSHSRSIEENIYVVDGEWAPALRRYSDLLSFIRGCYHETAAGTPLPPFLRAPIIDEEEIVRVRREVRRSPDGNRGEYIHINYSNCRTKYIEDKGRTLIIVGEFNPQ